MKKILLKITLILCVSSSWAQKDNFGFSFGKSCYIETYDLEDKTTDRFIITLLEDTNNIVCMNGYDNWLLKSYISGYSPLWGGEAPLCNENIKLFENIKGLDRLVGSHSEYRKPFFTYFKDLDSIKFNRVIKSMDLNNFNNFDSTEVDLLCKRLIKEYSFSSLDSLILMRNIYGYELKLADLAKIGLKKRLIILLSDYERVKEPQRFLLSHPNESIYFLIAHKSNRINAGGFYWFRNRIKNGGKLRNFSLIPKEDLPKKIKLTRKDSLNKIDVKESYQFIYVDKLEYCVR